MQGGHTTVLQALGGGGGGQSIPELAVADMH